MCEKIRYILMAVLMTAATLATAQDAKPEPSPLELDPLIVSARGVGTLMSETPGGVGLITERELQTRDLISIPDYMQLIPGVSRTKDSAWSSDVNIRGLSRDAVVLLLDGCRVNTATDLNAQYGLIDPMEIERVEVLKGPISALYGSGSIGGVVNVITRSGRFSEQPEEEAGLSLTARSNPKGAGFYGYGAYNTKDAYIYASQSYRTYDSYEDGDGDEMRNSQFHDYESKLKGGLRLSPLQTLEAQVQYYEGRDIGIPGAGTGALPKNQDVTYPSVRRVLTSADYTWEPEGPRFKWSTLKLYYQRIDRRVIIDNFPVTTPPPPAPVAINPGADHHTYGGKWQNCIDFGDHRVIAGADVWDRQLRNSFRYKTLNTGKVLEDQPLPRADYYSAGLFAEDNWRIGPRLLLNLGARADSIYVENDANALWDAREENDAGWNAHAGATCELTESLSASWIVAHGYRAATIEERYKYLDLGSVQVWGDPALEPEESTFTEAGLTWVNSFMAWTASAFYNNLHDLIAETVVDAQTRRMANINEAEIYGFELEGRCYIDEIWQLYANAAWADGRDTRNHEYLPNVPPLNGLAGIRCETEKGPWGYLETAWAARQDHTPEGIDSVDSWQTLSCRVGYDFECASSSHRIFVGVDNILDENYQDYLTTSRGFVFNEPGRSFVAGYEVTF